MGRSAATVHGPRRATPPRTAARYAHHLGPPRASCTLHLCGLRLAAPPRRRFVPLARPAAFPVHHPAVNPQARPPAASEVHDPHGNPHGPAGPPAWPVVTTTAWPAKAVAVQLELRFGCCVSRACIADRGPGGENDLRQEPAPHWPSGYSTTLLSPRFGISVSNRSNPALIRAPP